MLTPISTMDAAPVGEAKRIATLDILRGFAVLGILLMNIWGFGIATGGNFMNDLFADLGSRNFKTFAIIDVLFEGKMRALFCILFGAGILLFTQNKNHLPKKQLRSLFYTRMLWLVVFGLVNAHVLLWMGDILYFYGVFGMLVFVMRNMRSRYMLLAMPIVVVFSFVFNVMFYQDMRNQRLAYVEAHTAQQEGKTLSAQQQQAFADWREVEKMYIPNVEDNEKSISNMRGNYTTVGKEVRPMAFRFETKFLLMELGDNVALMLLGMALLKLNFLNGGWTTRQYGITMLLGYLIGLAVVIYTLWDQVTHRSTTELMLKDMENTPIQYSSLLYHLQRIALVMAHSAFIILMVKSKFLKSLMNAFRAAGQMALTNYIMQSILCTLFFFGYGMGYYNKLELYQLYYVVAAVWLLQLVYSPIWLRYYRFGPLEWLWRSLTYGKQQPMKRH